VADHEHALALVGNFDEILGMADIECERLLDINVFAGLERLLP
jgi:hypothetical protein